MSSLSTKRLELALQRKNKSLTKYDGSNGADMGNDVTENRTSTLEKSKTKVNDRYNMSHRTVNPSAKKKRRRRVVEEPEPAPEPATVQDRMKHYMEVTKKQGGVDTRRNTNTGLTTPRTAEKSKAPSTEQMLDLITYESEEQNMDEAYFEDEEDPELEYVEEESATPVWKTPKFWIILFFIIVAIVICIYAITTFFDTDPDDLYV